MLLGMCRGKNTGGGAPATPPTLSTAVVPANGATIALTFAVPSEPLLPASGITGLTVTVDAVSATFTAARTANTVITLTMDVAIGASQAVLVSYAPGNITDTATTALEAFTDTAATNNSTYYLSTKALDFDGVNEYCNRADAAAHDFTTAMTLSVWVKAASAADFAGIAMKHDYGTTQNSFAILRVGAIGKYLIWDGSNTKQYTSALTSFDNTWHHMVMTFGASTLKIYVDQVLDASPTKNNDDACTTLKNSTEGFRIGSQKAAGTPSNFLTGRLNNISLWSIALSQAEVEELANGGKPADLSLHSQYASCVSWYKCGDGDTIGANGILDSTTNALHLSPTNMESGDIVTDAP